jgi:hypothetical protein
VNRRERAAGRGLASPGGAIVLTSACGLLILAAACGRRGDPLPPLRPEPAVVGDARARRIDDRVEVRFTVPAANADGTTPSVFERIEIYGLASVATAALPTVAGP